MPVRAERVEGLTRQGFTEAYAVVDQQPFREPEVWQDEVRIEGVRRIHGDLVIRPGTTVQLGPGASLVVYGQLLAQGEEGRPIRFIPARSGESPWGVVALQGRGASGSRLSFCEFTGGSGLEGDLFEYSGMLSIHDVDDVRVSNCRFRDNRLVDDMVHAVYSSITFSDCMFEGAFADALDLDICTAVIERCAFHESGNDALDLMTSEVVVRDSLLRASADKGISVGERSHLFAFNDRMAGNVIGVQSKDASVAVLYNVDLQGNQKALDAYKKNWQYGTGGKIRLYKGNVAGNMELFTADEDSYIWVYDSYVEGRLAELKQVTIDPTVDAVRPHVARWGALWRHPEEKAEPPMLSDYWSNVDPKRRGATRLDY